MAGFAGIVAASTTAAAVGATTQPVQSVVVLRGVSIGTHSVAINNTTNFTIGNGYVLYGNDSVSIPVGFWRSADGGQATMGGLYIISDATTQSVSWFSV